MVGDVLRPGPDPGHDLSAKVAPGHRFTHRPGARRNAGAVSLMPGVWALAAGTAASGAVSLVSALCPLGRVASCNNGGIRENRDRPTQPHRWRLLGQSREDRGDARRWSPATVRTSSCFPELFLTGYPPQDLLEKRVVHRQGGGGAGLPRRPVGALRRDRHSHRHRFPQRTHAREGPAQLRRPREGGLDAVQAEQDAAPHLRRVRRGALLRPSGPRRARRVRGRAARRDRSARTPGTTPRSGAGPSTTPTRSRSSAARAPRSSSTSPPRRSRWERTRSAIACSPVTPERHGVPFVLVNQVGGNDELVFDGHSMLVGADGALVGLPAGVRRERACRRYGGRSSTIEFVRGGGRCGRPRRPRPRPRRLRRQVRVRERGGRAVRRHRLGGRLRAGGESRWVRRT